LANVMLRSPSLIKDARRLSFVPTQLDHLFSVQACTELEQSHFIAMPPTQSELQFARMALPYSDTSFVRFSGQECFDHIAQPRPVRSGLHSCELPPNLSPDMGLQYFLAVDRPLWYTINFVG